MTYPTAALGQLFHRGRLADDTSDVAPLLSMHNAIDLNLNRGAAILRAQQPTFTATMSGTGGTAVAAAANIPFNAVSVDTAGAWDATNHRYVCPKAGIYLVSASVNNDATTDAGAYIQIPHIDGTIYPSTALYGGLSHGATYDPFIIPAFPMVCAAGDFIQIAAAPAVGLTVFNDPRTNLSITYLGSYGSALTGGTSPDDSPSPLWTPGEPVDDLRLSRRFTDPMNALQPYLANWGQQRAIYLGYTSSGTTAVGDPIEWTTIIDTANVMDDSIIADTAYTCPVDGLYIASCLLVQTSTGATIQFGMLDGYSSYGYAGTTEGGSAAAMVSMFRGIGNNPAGTQTEVQILPSETFTPSTQFRSYFAVCQIA